jgi:hypothetical protein
MLKTTDWARQTVGGAVLGDRRRTERLVRMLTGAAERPAGSVTGVFGCGADRQAAYDQLENEAVEPCAYTSALARSTAHAGSGQKCVLMVLDGTSLTVTDRGDAKGLGSIGAIGAGARGVKLINAIALTPAGEPIGIADQQWWTRQQRAPRGVYRSADSRESKHWRSCAATISDTWSKLAPETELHFVADREADASLFIWQLIELGHSFTIRSNSNRTVLGARGAAALRPALAQQKPLATMDVSLSITPRRKARTARLAIRAATMTVRMRDHHVHQNRLQSLTFVWAREERSRGGIDWMLVTNVDMKTPADACEAVRRYTKRWRIEDFHRTWKSGLCNVESTQLRSAGAIIKWATILAAVALRAEALRHHAREQPDEAATTILTQDEIEALIVLKTRIKSRVETITADGLTVKQAVRWIADIGGYTGNNNSGKPGPKTIGRGLDQLIPVSLALGVLRAAGKLR